MTFLTGSPLTVDSSLHVPSLSVGLTYTKGSWWMVTIWGRRRPGLGRGRVGAGGGAVPFSAPRLSWSPSRSQIPTFPPPAAALSGATPPASPPCCLRRGRDSAPRGHWAYNTAPGHLPFSSRLTRHSLHKEAAGWNVQSVLGTVPDASGMRNSWSQPRACPMRTGPCPLTSPQSLHRIQGPQSLARLLSLPSSESLSRSPALLSRVPC